MSNSSKIIDRMRIAAGAESDTDLSDRLKKPRSTVGTWRRRETVPFEECIKLAVDNGLSLDWMFLGKNDDDSVSCAQIEIIKNGWKPDQVRDNPDTVNVPYWSDVSDQCVAFRVGDDSMINVGIGSGSIVIVKREENVPSGTIALVDLWGAFTVKYYYCSNKGEVMLKPANSSHVETRFNIQESEDIKPIGQVVAMIRNFTGGH